MIGAQIIWKVSNFCKVVNRHYLKIWHWVSTVMMVGHHSYVISVMLLQWECKKIWEPPFLFAQSQIEFFFNTTTTYLLVEIKPPCHEWKGREGKRKKLRLAFWLGIFIITTIFLPTTKKKRTVHLNFKSCFVRLFSRIFFWMVHIYAYQGQVVDYNSSNDSRR